MIHKVIVPDNRLVNISFTVPDNYVGEELEIIAFSKAEIEPQQIMNKSDTFSMAGNPVSIDDFVKWVDVAEEMPTISLKDAKVQWIEKRKLLQQTIR